MNGMESYIIILVIVLLIAYLITRNQSRAGTGGPYGTGYGNEEPYYDDPDVQGSGSFGRNRGSDQSSNLRRVIDNDATQPRGSRRDSPNVQGRGSFGKDKR